MNACSPTVFYPVFLSCISNSHSIPSIAMLVTNADSNSLISSEVMDWCSFVNRKKKALFVSAHPVSVWVSQCTHGFFSLQCVI